MFEINNFIPQGVEDIHCDEYETKESMIIKIKEIFKRFGYRQILTPTFEYYDLFLGVEGTIDRDEMFKFIDANGKVLVLRPDVTTPIARMAATNYKSSFNYLKFCYATNIFRINDSQYEKKREFTQAGVEYLGNQKPDSDAEVIALAIRSLISCDLEEFQVDLGQAGYFKGLIEELGISEQEQLQIRNLVENKNFAELNQWLGESDIDSFFKDIISKIPFLYGKPEEVIADAQKLVCNRQMEEALDNLTSVYQILRDYGYEDYISIDLGFVHHINYYTGVIFKGYVNRYGKVVLNGGRYDHLTSQYGCPMPATGFGVNIDGLLEAMRMQKEHRDVVCKTDYLVLYHTGSRKKGLTLADKIREQGFIVESDLLENDINTQIQNARYRNIQRIIQYDDIDTLKIINVKDNTVYTRTCDEFFEKLNCKTNLC